MYTKRIKWLLQGSKRVWINCTKCTSDYSSANSCLLSFWFSIKVWHISLNILVLSSIEQIFGNIRGKRIAVVVDISDANAGFGRLTAFQESLVVSTCHKCSISWSVSNFFSDFFLVLYALVVNLEFFVAHLAPNRWAALSATVYLPHVIWNWHWPLVACSQRCQLQNVSWSSEIVISNESNRIKKAEIMSDLKNLTHLL